MCQVSKMSAKNSQENIQVVKEEKNELEYINKLIQQRSYSAYTKGRKDPCEFFERPKSKREWWRTHVSEYPVPGTYNMRDFYHISQMNPIQATYNFKGQGRNKRAGVAPLGELLLPGAYDHRDFVQDLENRRIATPFKSSGRLLDPTGFQDKDLNLPPWRYSLIRSPVKKQKATHSMFKSQSSRFPSNQFKAREGPPPGAYNPCQPSYKYPVSSSFASGTKRFGTSHTKVPGPGAYDPTIHKYPQIPTLKIMGKVHGLYFTNTFQA